MHDTRTTRRPRLLYLGHNLPFPPHEGALIRSYHTVRILAHTFDVTGLYFYRKSAVRTGKEMHESLGAMREFGQAEAFSIPQESSTFRLIMDHARSVVTGTPYTRWMHESRQFRKRLGECVQSTRFDICHVDSIDLMAHLPNLPVVPRVLVHHNVESALLLRRAEPERGFKAAYIRYQARLVRDAERRWCPLVDLNVVVSEQDRVTLSKIAPDARFLTVPNGVDTRSLTPTQAEPAGGIVFVGGYSWFPNREGMEFFGTEILPLIRRVAPATSVTWIGRIPSDAAARFRAFGIEVAGYVDDIRPILSEARCVIVPLRVGGGTRLKILDAWALGKAIVSTSLGCEGLAIRHGENILIADAPEDFAARVLAVLSDNELRRRLEEGGRQTAVQTYDWDVLERTMNDAYGQLLAANRHNGCAPC